METAPQLIESLPPLGAAIRARRKSLRLRIDDAAALIGISVDALSRLETGKGVRMDSVLKALDGLGLTLVLAPKDSEWIARVRQSARNALSER